MQKNKIINNICQPANTNYRFALGNRGKPRNLLVIALNPNTANHYQHDSTTRKIAKIAKDNDFDGWLLFNLYPLREAKPDKLPIQPDEQLLKENLAIFKNYVDDKAWGFEHCWLAWGNGVVKNNYLLETAITMLDLLEQKQINYYCIARTQQHHPYHSSQQVINSFFKNTEAIKLQSFPAQGYKELILKYNFSKIGVNG